MLNKKAIAAFAAGATLLSGLAVAAPALAANEKGKENTAAAADAKTPKAKLEEKVNTLKAAVEQDKKDVKTKQDAKDAAQKAVDDNHTLKALQATVTVKQDAVDDAQKAVNENNTKKANTKAAVTTAVEAVKSLNAKADKTKQVKFTFDNDGAPKYEAATGLTFADSTTIDTAVAYTTAKAAAEAKLVPEGTKDEDSAFAVYKAEFKALQDAAKNANSAIVAAAKIEDATVDAKLKTAQEALTTAKTALEVYTKADASYAKLAKDLTDADAAVKAAQAKQTADEASLKEAQDLLAALTPATPDDHKGGNTEHKGGEEHKGGNTEHKGGEEHKGGNTTTTPTKPEEGKVVLPKKAEELKAYVEQVKAALKAEKDAKKAEAVKAAFAEFGKAAKALKANKGDKAAQAAFAAALKKLAALVPYVAAKPAPKPSDPTTIVDAKATDLLYTQYQGMFADLAARGVTNVAAYDALLDKLEFGLKQTGWENILKNFGGNNCAYLNVLRRQLQKAVLHYGHVEAAVKDIVAELTEDYNDAKASENWDAAKVIKEKLAKARGLLGVSDNNRTRAAALLDSANDHARDLSCDTGAKEVLDAMKPGKPAPAPAPKTPKAPKLPNTGAVVALAAVAASVLAGMGAALRKIRH